MRNGDARPTKLSVEGATKYYQTKTGLVHALEDYTMQVKEGASWSASSGRAAAASPRSSGRWPATTDGTLSACGCNLRPLDRFRTRHL